MKYIVCILLGIAVGITIGLYRPTSTSMLPAETAVCPDIVRMSQIATSLRLLRGGKSDLAIEALEGFLDSDLITLAGLARQRKIDIAKTKSIKAVKAYRSDYHRSIDPSGDALMNEVLSKVSDP